MFPPGDLLIRCWLQVFEKLAATKKPPTYSVSEYMKLPKNKRLFLNLKEVDCVGDPQIGTVFVVISGKNVEKNYVVKVKK